MRGGPPRDPQIPGPPRGARSPPALTHFAQPRPLGAAPTLGGGVGLGTPLLIPLSPTPSPGWGTGAPGGAMSPPFVPSIFVCVARPPPPDVYIFYRCCPELYIYFLRKRRKKEKKRKKKSSWE